MQQPALYIPGSTVLPRLKKCCLKLSKLNATRTNTDNMLGAAVIYSALGDLYSKMGQTLVAAEYRKKCRQMQAEQCGDNKLMLFLNLVADIWPKYHSGDKGGCLSDIDAIESVVESMKGMYNIDSFNAVAA